jgi:hypothetical protein
VLGKPSILLVVAAICLGLIAECASAASSQKNPQCGTEDPQSNEPVKAVLTLKPDSVTTRAFKRNKDSGELSLIFGVDGCKLVQSQVPEPEVRLLPAKDLDELPDEAVTLASAEVDGAELTVLLDVDPTKFDPGSYGGLLGVRAPAYLAPNRTLIAVSRTETDWWIPLGIAVAGGFVGCLWLLVSRNVRIRLKFWKKGRAGVGVLRVVVVCIAVIAGGLIAGFGAYLTQDVWTVDDNGWQTGVTAFLAATAASFASLLPARE